jgi:hypothetical protein
LSSGGETETPDDINIYEAKSTPVVVVSQSVPNEDIKGHVAFQAWSSKDWRFDTDFPIVGYIGPSGLGIKAMCNTGEQGGNFTINDRYANLLPTEAGTSEFLAADMDNGVLALQSANELLIFQLSWLYWNGASRDYCSTVCSNGLLYINGHLKPAPYLTFIPFNPRENSRRFRLQWSRDSKWLPWAIAATPDASTVAIIGQETDSDNSINAHYGRARVLIYHPGALAGAPSGWPIQNAFQVDAPTAVYSGLAPGSVPRFLALDPDARALLYWNSTTTVTRYDATDGKPLGQLELGQVSARSRDGRRVAAISPAGRIRVYDLGTGDTVLDQQGKPASGICFSADGSRLVASQEGMINTYDVPSGRTLSSVASSLIPLAYPSQGNRLLAFQPDHTGIGGSVVLADTGDAHVAAVLSRAGSSFTPAYFSDSGNQIAISSRFNAEIVRSLRPEELPAVLNTSLPKTVEIPALPATNIVTTAPATVSPASIDVLAADNTAGLESRIGDLVTVQGQVRNVKMVTTGSAANIYFDGTGTTPTQVWVPWNTLPKVQAVLGKDLATALEGRTIKATGRLSIYKGSIELTLEDAAKLELIGPEARAK